MIYKNLYLDSSKADISSDGKVFRWGLSPDRSVRDGIANCMGPINNVIGIHLAPPVIPNITYDRISVSFEPFGSQSVITSSGHRYHFLFRTNIAVRNQLSRDHHDSDIYWFNPPMQTDYLEVRFGDPSNVITLSNERFCLNVTIIQNHPNIKK